MNSILAKAQTARCKELRAPVFHIYGATVSELLMLYSKSAILLTLFSFAISDLQYSLISPHFYEKILI